MALAHAVLHLTGPGGCTYLPSISDVRGVIVTKWIYFFGAGQAEGQGAWHDLLGGKGAGLADMTRIGLPVPAGFTITTEACDYYFTNGRQYPADLSTQVATYVARLEEVTGRTLGGPTNPLLVSVRSGAARSMPGMLETILNLGLNDRSVAALATATHNERFACDAYRRFVQMYATVVKQLPREHFEHRLRALKQRLGVDEDTAIPAAQWRALVADYKAHYRDATGLAFPDDPMEQLWGAIGAVFDSWMADKAVTYRRVEHISDLLGTAVNVVQMVFGNTGERSGTGVCFTRNPSSGAKELFGDYLPNAQGEDVVAGIRTPMPLREMANALPAAAAQLDTVGARLEAHYRDMQDMEFTVENGTLYMLQTRAGKRAPAAAFRIAVDMATEGLISREEAVTRVTPQDIERLFYPVIDTRAGVHPMPPLLRGINAVPGAAVGRVVFSPQDAQDWVERGEKIILVRRETSPDDVAGIAIAEGVLTTTGGQTSHAAVVARGWGKCCVVGATALSIDYVAKTMTANDTTIAQGDWITLDGSEGAVYAGQRPLIAPQPPPSYATLMDWADAIRTLGVRSNADTPQDAERARAMGAEGIGLCRTEHMFFTDFDQPERSRDRQLAIQEMILARTQPARVTALRKLLPFQRRDFIGIFRAMDGLPVTIRLIDPPLHEFLPHTRSTQEELARELDVSVEAIVERVAQLHETNPMLGHRGSRLAISYPEILEMQVRAIVEAALECKAAGITVLPEIMIPLTMDREELRILEQATRRVADELIARAGVTLPYRVGTMIEIPRAALLASEIAEVAEFFSFGTNDLTQTTLGLSRDDAGRFLPEYVDEAKAGIFAADPFQTLDRKGVGLLMRWAVAGGRATRPDLKIGICGEHGGDAESVKFCHTLGIDYVSASPFRVPIARLAAAQAVIESRAGAS